MMRFLSVMLQTYSVQTNFAMKRTHHKFFLEYVPKTCLRKNKKRKSLLFEKKDNDGPAY